MRYITNKNLGAKYGVKVRKQYIKYYNLGHNLYNCKYCNWEPATVTRVSSGIWSCRKCNKVFVGYAYHPYSDL